MNTSYDAVVIGAGHNGLTTAAYLARAGVSTLLVEARRIVGGTAASERLGDSVVNVCNCDHFAFRTTPIAEELDLASHGLTYIDLDPAQVNGSWESDRWWPSYFALDRTVEAIARVLPDEARNYERYVHDALPVVNLILEAARRPPSVGGLLGVVARQKGIGAQRLLRWSRMSTLQVLQEYFRAPEIIGPALIEGPMVWGVSPTMKRTGLGALPLAMRHAGRLGRPIGGSGALTDALHASFTAAGGVTRLGTRVTAIVCHGETSRSVELSDGDVIDARVVISACNPHDTFLTWLRNPPPSARNLVRRWRATPRAVGYESKIDAVIDGSISFKALDNDLLGDLNQLPATYLVAPSAEKVQHGYTLMESGGILRQPAFLVNVPSLADTTLTTPGQHVFSLEALFTPYGFSDGWDSDSEPRRWLSEFDSLLIDPVTPRLVDWRAVTPRDYESDFHLPAGHATSFAGGPLAAFAPRDPELVRYRTAVANLYITGAATFPGSGVWGASGRNAAQVVLADLGLGPKKLRRRGQRPAS
jgi:phytoene dehydrogenase-like protein